VIHVVGHTAIDHILRVPVLPARHTSTYIRDHQVYFGGGAANIAAGIARLGSPAGLVSAVGGDFAGSDYERWLQVLGVSTEMIVVPEAPTPTAYMFTDDAGDQITFFEWGASAAFATADAPSLPFVHLATADPGFNVRVAARAAFASFDPGQDIGWYTKEQLEAILARIAILFANRHEMATLCRVLGRTQEEIIAGVPLVIVTMDAEGSEVHAGGNVHLIPVVPVPLRDPTGAGDAYRAGFLSAYARGYGPEACGRIGTVTASFAVESVGCQTNLPAWEQMEHRHREHFGPLPAPLPGGGTGR
jgi:nucleoside kinase